VFLSSSANSISVVSISVMKDSSLSVPLGGLDFFSIGFRVVPNPLSGLGYNDDGGGDVLVGGVVLNNVRVLVLCVKTELLE
jgi:hypothetical protein